MKRLPPIPVNLGDCILMHQMGYTVEVNDGDTITIKRRNRVLTKKYIKEQAHKRA
jgi:hypothetical protein